LILALILVLIGNFWSYRKERFLSFLTKGKVYEEKYFQVEQSISAISSGGLFGKGLGKSEIKIIGLPQMLTDSIFAIYAEETGFFWFFNFNYFVFSFDFKDNFYRSQK
jgi:cell division protein FtsW